MPILKVSILFNKCIYRFRFVLLQSSANAWQKAFWIAAAVYIVGTLIFVVFGTGRRQPWGVPPDHPKPDAETEMEKSEQIVTDTHL
jgi:sugar phosphate permease